MPKRDEYYHSIEEGTATHRETKTQPVSNAHGKGMLQFIAGAKGLRSAIGSDIPLQQIMILVHLWLQGRCRQTDLCKELGMLRAAVSRHCRSMSSYYVPDEDGAVEKGQHLLIAERDTYMRHEYYSLSEQGKEIMDSFAAALEGMND